MSVWILRQSLSAAAEARIMERMELLLPFGDLPDLTRISSPQEAFRMMKLLYPEEPPESLRRRLDQFWHPLMTLQTGDTLAVPLTSLQSVALAEVTGHYKHMVGINGKDLHLIPVRWVREPLPLAKFGKHKKIFEHGSDLFEVSDREARIAISDKLPHKYNRFVKWKWLLMLFFILNLIAMLAQYKTFAP